MMNYIHQDITVDIFTLVQQRKCSKRQRDGIEKEIIKYINNNNGIYCTHCRKDINRIIFIYVHEQYYCPSCFQQLKDSKYLCIFVDIPKYAETIIHPQIKSVPQSKEREQNKQKKRQSKVILSKEKQMMFQNLRNNFWTTNTDIMDFIAGEIHSKSNEKEKEFIMNKICHLSKQRELNFKRIQKLVQKHEQRHLKPELFHSSEQSMSEFDESSISIQEIRQKSKKLINQLNEMKGKNKVIASETSKKIKKINKK